MFAASGFTTTITATTFYFLHHEERKRHGVVTGLASGELLFGEYPGKGDKGVALLYLLAFLMHVAVNCSLQLNHDSFCQSNAWFRLLRDCEVCRNMSCCLDNLP